MVDKLLSWTFVITVGLLPLLVRVKLIEFVSPKIIHDLVDTGIKADVFSYYRWVFLLLITAIAITLLIFKMVAYRYELRSSYLNPLLLILAALTLLSGALSEFPSISMAGMYNNHEGTLTYLCYFALAFVGLNTSFTKSFGRNIMLALFIVLFLNLIIILFSFYQQDLLTRDVIRNLMVPTHLSQTDLSGNLKSTLSNPNYVSGFSASMMAFFMTFALIKKNFFCRFVAALFSVFSFAILLASLSASGFFTIVIMLPIILTLSLLSRTYIKSLITLVAMFAACAGVFLVLSNHNPKVLDESVGSFKSILKVIRVSAGQTKDGLSCLVNPKSAWAATASPPEVINSETLSANKDLFNLPESTVGTGSGRIYIWQKTIDLIKRKPMLGYGRDTLTYYFPQNDKYKIANLGSYDEIVTKAHNAYLDMAYSSGIISLIVLVWLILYHLYDTVRNLIKKSTNNDQTAFQGATFSFLCAFLIQWMFNDSVIGTSVVFWTLLGVSASINNKIASVK